MARSTPKQRDARSLEVVECCGRVRDERWWEASIRDRQFDRRLSMPGSVRMSG